MRQRQMKQRLKEKEGRKRGELRWAPSDHNRAGESKPGFAQ
jgi:hypothetical protein